MKALTVQQPWAWAIVEGGKDVENRTQVWSYRGSLAIHAGARISERGFDSPLIQAASAEACERNDDVIRFQAKGAVIGEPAAPAYAGAREGSARAVDPGCRAARRDRGGAVSRDWPRVLEMAEASVAQARANYEGAVTGSNNLNPDATFGSMTDAIARLERWRQDAKLTELVSPAFVLEHDHRWLWFGATGERDEFAFTVVGGVVVVPEAELVQLLRRAGYKPADPDPVESAWLRRREWARSRLQDSLNRALNRRAD